MLGFDIQSNEELGKGSDIREVCLNVGLRKECHAGDSVTKGVGEREQSRSMESVVPATCQAQPLGSVPQEDSGQYTGHSGFSKPGTGSAMPKLHVSWAV